MQTTTKTRAGTLQAINALIADHEELYRSDLNELIIPIIARFRHNEHCTITLNPEYIADSRDVVSELIKVVIRQMLNELKNDSGRYPSSCAGDCGRIEKWLLTH